MTSNNIKVYLVGGAVRDLVLGRSSKDLDFVVVGATRGYMEGLGFDQVGADFPVFLHPKTKDEFALARVERKTEAGYHGFDCDFNIDVTLEDDLERRDLTMNSMAIEVDKKILETGKMVLKSEIIDPYNGQLDAHAGILRHTSEAFAEDPLRVLRTCRFAARYNFEIADETVSLMRNIVAMGEMTSLSMERVYVEFEKAVMEDHPHKFFDYMNECGAMNLYFHELCDWNNSGLEFAININASLEERIALLVMGFHSVDAERMLKRIKAPNHVIDTAVWSCNIERMINDLLYSQKKPEAYHIWDSLNRANAWRNVEKMQRIAHIHLYWGGREVFDALRVIMEALVVGSKIGFGDLDPNTRDALVGKEIGEAISQKRLEVLEELNLFPS